MNFYTFKHAVATKETGNVFPQIQEMNKGYDYDSANSVYALGRFFDQIPTITPDLRSFVLHKKSCVTELFSTALLGDNGFLISKKLKDIFANYKMPLHRYFPASIRKGTDVISDYYWLHIVSDYIDWVDFENSEFTILELYSKVIGRIKLSSKEDFYSKQNELKNQNKYYSIWATNIIFNKNFDKKINFLRLPFYRDYIISEELKDEITLKKLTGISMPLATNICL